VSYVDKKGWTMDAYTQHEPGTGMVDIFPVVAAENVLTDIITDIFQNYWEDVVFGSLVQGAVFEIHAPNAPQRISVFDGYMTINFGAWHFHLCVGENKGTPKFPTDPALTKVRKCARAEFYRILNADGAPKSWGFRMFNGAGEQMMTVFFPNPFITKAEKIRKEPDWSRLQMWDTFRKTYLGLDADPKDRTLDKFRCGG
jgi:hypothetical protein